jgi:D-aspartate ligase
MTTTQPPVFLIGGLENALSVARSLWRRGVEVHASGAADSPVRLSRSRRSFHPVDGDLDAAWLDWLGGRPEGALVFPCADESMEFVAHHRATLEDAGLVVLEADDDAVLAMLDKDRTYAIARAAGVAAPDTVRVVTADDLESAIQGIGFPCALKPIHTHEFSRHFRAKVMVAHDEATLRSAFAATQEAGLSMILTEIIPGGEERYCSYFTWIDPDGSFLFDFTKRKLRQYPVGFGGGTYHLTEWADDVAETGRRFLSAAGVRGLGNVEFKRDPRDGSLKLIECNARFTAGNEIVRRAGVDIAWIAYARMTGQPLPPIRRGRDGVYMWYPLKDTLAFLELRRRGETATLDWVRGLAHRQTFPIWSASDPMPSLAELARVPARVVRKLRRRSTSREATGAPVSL